MTGQPTRVGQMAHAWWTPEREAILRRLWDEDLSASKIAARMGTTKNAIIGKSQRLRLTPRRIVMLYPR